MSAQEFSPFQPLLPELPPDEQVTSQPLFLPGTLEAQIEANLASRGWSWHLVRVIADEALLLERRNETENDQVLTPSAPFLGTVEEIYLGSVTDTI